MTLRSFFKWFGVYTMLFTILSCNESVTYCDCVDILEGNGRDATTEELKDCMIQFAADYDSYRDEMNKEIRTENFNRVEKRKKDCYLQLKK